MIPANKNQTVDWMLYRYLRRKVRERFHNVSVRGLEHLSSLPGDRPVIAFSNHTNWWDGLMVFLLTRQAGHKNFFCMMEEKQLRHYQFFTWLGAFSVDLSSPLRAAATVRYAVRLLEKNSTLLWIFPGGRMVAPHQPIHVLSGTHFLATQSVQAVLLPVAFRYEFFREDRPRALIEIGAPFSAVDSSDERIEEACNAVADRLNEVVLSQDLTGFEALLRSRLPINKQWEWVRLAVRGRLAEFDPAN